MWCQSIQYKQSSVHWINELFDPLLVLLKENWRDQQSQMTSSPRELEFLEQMLWWSIQELHNISIWTTDLATATHWLVDYQVRSIKCCVIKVKPWQLKNKANKETAVPRVATWGWLQKRVRHHHRLPCHFSPVLQHLIDILTTCIKKKISAGVNEKFPLKMVNLITYPTAYWRFGVMGVSLSTLIGIILASWSVPFWIFWNQN